MISKQLEVLIINILGFNTDSEMRVYDYNNIPFTINGMPTYINIYGNHLEDTLDLDIVNDIYDTVNLFEHVIYNMYERNGIRVYAYYTELDGNKLSVNIKTECNLITSKSYNNHCLAYIDILLKLFNVDIDLSKYDKGV